LKELNKTQGQDSFVIIKWSIIVGQSPGKELLINSHKSMAGQTKNPCIDRTNTINCYPEALGGSQTANCGSGKVPQWLDMANIGFAPCI
jgi:hypothetical protein